MLQYYGGWSFGGCGEYGYNEAGECQLAEWSGVSDTMVCQYAKTVMYYVGMMGTAAERPERERTLGCKPRDNTGIY